MGSEKLIAPWTAYHLLVEAEWQTVIRGSQYSDNMQLSAVVKP